MHPASWRKKSWRGVSWHYSTVSKDGSDFPKEPQLSEDELRIRNNVLEAQILVLKKLAANEHATFMSEAETAEREKSLTILSEPDALVSIKENQLVRGSACTVLVMGDGSQRHMKTSTFDPDGAITQKAKRLVGSRIRTTCWDPKDSPGRWSSQGYFRNIYSAE
jgi:hypothetical protein